MSNDLISRSELMQGRVENDPVRIAAMCASPAYDLDAVCEEIADYRELVPAWALSEIIQIVRNGGKKE